MPDTGRFPLFAPKQAAEEILQGALTVVVMALQDDWLRRLMDWKTGGAWRGAGMNIKEDWEENKKIKKMMARW